MVVSVLLFFLSSLRFWCVFVVFGSIHSRMFCYTGLIGQMTTKARHFVEAYLASIEHGDKTNLSISQ